MMLPEMSRRVLVRNLRGENEIMARFRPIAPKPASSKNSSISTDSGPGTPVLRCSSNNNNNSSSNSKGRKRGAAASSSVCSSSSTAAAAAAASSKKLKSCAMRPLIPISKPPVYHHHLAPTFAAAVSSSSSSSAAPAAPGAMNMVDLPELKTLPLLPEEPAHPTSPSCDSTLTSSHSASSPHHDPLESLTELSLRAGDPRDSANAQSGHLHPGSTLNDHFSERSPSGNDPLDKESSPSTSSSQYELEGVRILQGTASAANAPSRHLLQRADSSTESRILEQAYESCTEPVALTNERGGMVWCNPAFKAIARPDELGLPIPLFSYELDNGGTHVLWVFWNKIAAAFQGGVLFPMKPQPVRASAARSIHSSSSCCSTQESNRDDLLSSLLADLRQRC